MPNDNSKTPSPQARKEVISDSSQPISHIQQNNHSLTTNQLTLGHLRIYLQMKFLSLRRAGNKAGLSYSRVKQLVTGKYLPTKPELIKNLSEAWDIDPIKLTQMFERYRDYHTPDHFTPKEPVDSGSSQSDKNKEESK